MKNQALFSLKDKSKKLKCSLLQFLFGALRINLKVKNLLWKQNLFLNSSPYEKGKLCRSNHPLKNIILFIINL